jgi:dCTP deaminase
MILTGLQIEKDVANGKIIIEPFFADALNPNSYNFHLGPHLLLYKNEIIDTQKEQPMYETAIPEDGYILQPGELYLGHTQEVMGSDYYAPFIFGRSSIGRLGLFVQITAPLGDIGFKGCWTLQLTPVRPTKVYVGMRIGQIFFIAPQGDISLYDGKYQSATGPRKSEVFRDFTKMEQG